MTYRLMLLLLVFGLVFALPASAQWSFSDDEEKKPPTTTTTTTDDGGDDDGGDETGMDDDGTGADDGGAPAADETAPPPRVIPSKAAIRALVEEEQLADAEAAYLQWASYWREDDPLLIIQIERGILLRHYRDGNFAALIALVEAGDIEARRLLRAAVLAGGSGLPSAEFVAGIRFLGQIRDASALNMLRLSIYSEDEAVVIAAIDALGDIGDKRVVPELLGLFDTANDAKSVALARALGKLGAAKQVRARFTPQLNFPLAGAKEKAALVLGVLGDPSGWNILADMASKKTKDYYPLVLTVLAELPSEESTEYLTAALVGNEAEQLTAFTCLRALSTVQANRTLYALAQSEETPMSVRVAAIDLLATRRYGPAMKYLRAVVANLAGEAPATEPGPPPPDAEGDAEKPVAKPVAVIDPAVKAAAIKAMPKYGMLNTQSVREMIRQRFHSPLPDVVFAARVALLRYAMGQLTAK